jgi:hypothetical protein
MGHHRGFPNWTPEETCGKGTYGREKESGSLGRRRLISQKNPAREFSTQDCVLV